MAEIRSQEDLERWLEARPPDRRRDEARAIAARAALRLFPLVFTALDVPHRRLDIETKQGLILQSFRAVFISWVACKYPLGAVNARTLEVTARAAATAARAAAGIADVATTATRAASRAAAGNATAAAAAARTAADATGSGAASWKAVAVDCAWLEAPDSDGRLIDEPLWLVDVRGDPKFNVNMPRWARHPLDAFAESEMARKGPWAPIVDWYRSVLSHRGGGAPKSLFGEKADIEIATQPNDFWTVTETRGADRIMQDVFVRRWWEEPEPADKPDRTVAGFIVEFLDSRDAPATIDEIRSAFVDADYRVVDKTMRGELSRLAMAERIARVSTGVYSSAKAQLQKAEPPPASVEQGVGPVFSAVGGRLSRIPHYPVGDELTNPTLRKLHDRLKKRLGSLMNGLGANERARYPQLTDVLDDYEGALSVEIVAGIDIDDLWISGAGVIAQARSFAALDPSKQVTEPLEPQLQALLGEIARLHGALVMGFAKGRELAEKSGVPLLTPEEFRLLLEHERAIVRWLVETDQFAMTDQVRKLFEELDRLLVTGSESSEHLATLAYPIVRNLLIFAANAIGSAERTAGRLALIGVPVHLAVGGTLVFFRDSIGPIMGFVSSVPELRSYIEYHLRRLEIEWQDNHRRNG